MKREDVERMLAEAQPIDDPRKMMIMPPAMAAALCVRWLAVEDSPSVEWFGYGSDLPTLPAGQRVRIVPEGGGDGR